MGRMGQMGRVGLMGRDLFDSGVKRHQCHVPSSHLSRMSHYAIYTRLAACVGSPEQKSPSAIGGWIRMAAIRPSAVAR